MTERTDDLVRELARGLQPVRRLPALGRVAGAVALVAALLVGLELVVGYVAGTPLVKANFASFDLQTLVAHALLASSALAFALGAFVPGRERLMRMGVLGLGLAAFALGIVGSERLLAWSGASTLEAGWLRATLGCGLGAVVPAAIPALLLTLFAARAAPHRVARALCIAAAGSVALLTLPGILRCGYPDELHHVLGHLLAPVFGAVALLALALPVFVSARALRRR